MTNETAIGSFSLPHLHRGDESGSRSGHIPPPGPSSRKKAQDAARAGTFASGALGGAALLAAAAFLLAPSPARAVNECGALNAGNSFTETCADQAYASGIVYSVAGSATLTVGGGMATTITTPTTGASWNNGVTINVANSATRRDVSLTVGSAGAVAILQGSSPQANAWYRNNGIQVVQRSGGGSTMTVNVRSGVTIGTMATRMANRGISLGLDNTASTSAGAMSLTSGATIYAATHGINVGNPGPGATTVTNTGAIDASNQGIRVEDSGSAGAVTITNSGAITSGWQGIYAHARGTGKDAAGTNAGVSVTHSAGAITSSNNRGIHVLVGVGRQESNTGHASYVAPMNTGTAKVAVTGGSISARLLAIEAINYEAGGIDIDVSSGVTLTSSTGSGIYAGLHDVGNTAGGIDVDNAGDIIAARTGIWVRRTAPMGAGVIRVDNDGDLEKTGSAAGHGIRVDESGVGGVTVDNSGAIGDATTQHQHGIFVSHSSTGAGDVSITNSGALRASQSGIHLDNLGSGDSTVTNRGAITASQRGIYVRERGSAGAVTVENSGAITATWTGILAQTTNKDAANTNAGSSVTHTAGAISSTNSQGIQALVGVGRAEGDPADGAYVTPENTGTARVAVTGGSISARLNAVEAINLEAGGVDVDISSGVTLTSSTASGIFAGLIDVGNTAGAIDVDNAGDITAAVTGIWVRQNGATNTGAITIDNEGDIEKTGADEGYGIRVDQSGNGDITIVNSGDIGDATTRHTHGIWLPNPGSGDSTVTNNGGHIRASQRGIFVDDTGSAGAVTIENSGAITATWTGILAQTTNKDAANTNAGISVTHSGGAISSTNNQGIQALVGVGRAEGDPADGAYVTPENTGTAKIAVTGGSVSARLTAIEAINLEAGGVDVDVSSGVTLTSSTASGIFAGLIDVGNTAGAIDVDNAGDITAAVTGIWVRQNGATNTGAITIDNEGDVEKTGADEGYGIRVDQSGNGDITIVNSGDIGDIDDASMPQHRHGIWLPNPGSGDSTVDNRGAIRAERNGILVDDTGSAGAVTVANSGAITAQQGILARARGTGKDAANTNAGVSVTHSGGALRSTAGHGIEALVGVGRQEGNTGHDDYVAPKNEGLAKVAVTGGSISAQRTAIAAINYEAGSVEVRVSSGVTLTATAEAGIFAQVADVGNTDGTVTVVNAGTISAPAAGKRGIFAVNEAGGAVSVTNSGAITAGGIGIYADLGVVTVANGADITSDLSGIFARTPGSDAAGANLGVTVTHSGGAIASENGRGIRARVGAERQEVDASHDDYVAPRNTGLVRVAVTGGSIRARWPAIEALNYEAGSIDIDVAEGARLTSTANSAINAQLTDVGNARGTIDIDNAGTLDAAVSGVFARIVAGSGDMTVTNSGAIAADTNAIFLLGGRSYAGDVMLTNSGALGTADSTDTRTFRGIFVAHNGPGGAVTVANSGAIAATDYGILASKANGRGGGVTVTHSGGAIDVDSDTDLPVLDSQKHGIVARVGGWNQETDPDHPDYVAPRGAGLVKIDVTGGSISSRGTAVEGANYEGGGVEISVSKGVTLTSKREHGIEADLRDVGNTDGTIKITQAGAIRAGRDGISAVVTRSTPATLDEPVIDIAWTGTYAAPEQPAPDESIVFVAQAPGVVQAAQAVEAVDELRGGSAGIDAKVMEWQAFMGVVAEGDDPGAFADAAAQAALFDDAADAATQARAAAIVARLRSVLTAGTVTVGRPIRGAGDVDTDDDDEYSDEEIKTYLSHDSDARRTLLRNVLADSLTPQEMAVFQAVITGGDLTPALDAVTGATDEWKARVRALSESHNDGDIRIAMNEGSIVSRDGDGIRAHYAAHRDDNGRIEVTVAEGASVTGDMAGIYVGHGGLGLRVEKKYATEAVQDENENLGEDALVTVADQHNQVVRVHGTVTGGTDAAVHMDGGGALIVGRTGKLIAGSSGRALRVNHPHPAIAFIDGEVRGGAGPEGEPRTRAAVHLPSGGSVTVGQNGRVEAGGATSAIQSDGKTTEVTIDGTVQGAEGGRAAVHLAGGGRVAVGRNGRVEAGGAASAIRGEGEEATRVTIDGTVQGAEGGSAAVHLSGGGEVEIGLSGRVEANGAALAVRGDNKPTRVLLHVPGDRLTQENAREALTRVPGGIGGDSIVGAKGGGENRTTLVLVETDDGRTTGHYTDLPVGAGGNVVVDELPILEFNCAMAEDGRCGLYEALPSMLLTMNGLPSWAERTQAVRDGNGGWVRVEGAQGKWQAKKATTPGKLAFDHHRAVGRAGVDFLAGEQGRVGVSVHALLGGAEVSGVGEAKLNGMGAGVSATWLPDFLLEGLYVDAQAAMTRYEMTLDSATSGRLMKDTDGTGYAVGVDAGLRTAFGEGLVVTPRAGLAWSAVDFKDFTDVVGSGAHVSVKDAQSTMGRVGVTVETETGPEQSPGRVFASLDLEHDFSDETEVVVSRSRLRTELRTLGVRLGLGGVFRLGEDLSLRASAHYMTGGGDTNEYGGGVELALRF